MTLVINPITQSQTISINSFGIGLNSLPNGALESLMELKYSFAGFSESTIEAGIVAKDLVVFVDLPVTESNIYGAGLAKADTLTEVHASKNLFVFVSYINNVLILMHKGYLDFEDTSSESLNSWGNGDGLYINGSNISITPPQSNGSWVKSIGFCMPNIEGVKRIWFESDSTYFTIG